MQFCSRLNLKDDSVPLGRKSDNDYIKLFTGLTALYQFYKLYFLNQTCGFTYPTAFYTLQHVVGKNSY